jgi:hypothetical protein
MPLLRERSKCETVEGCKPKGLEDTLVIWMGQVNLKLEQKLLKLSIVSYTKTGMYFASKMIL